MISIVAAMTSKGVIGSSGKMPWRLPAELAYFKKLTLGKTVLMGRQTLESIGQPLPQRRNIVVSRSPHLSIPGCEVYSSLEAAFDKLSDQEELMIIGGGSVFEQTIHLADRMYLTFIDNDLPGDTHFPQWNRNDWKELHCYSHSIDERNNLSFNCFLFDRISRFYCRRADSGAIL
jgi:dihydrofolate reductase